MSAMILPPMGWNTWNTFYDKVSEELVLETMDAMIEKGFRELGYRYLILDDCWALKERDAQGQLVADPDKFPHGIKALADAVHAKGMKLGIYSCCGVRTCAGYPGSFDHEYDDARQFAQWGVDYLKYDNCNRPNHISSEILNRRMAMALRSTGREIDLATCQWGTEAVQSWIASTGARTFRSTVDIQDNWFSIESIARSRLERLSWSACGCFDDMDMLVVGLNGLSMNPEVNQGGCTDEEYQTHFALWAMLNAPLILGCDVRKVEGRALEILQNKTLIKINQDPACKAPFKIPVYGNDDAFVLVKLLSDGTYAIGLFNFGDTDANVSVELWDIGLTLSSNLRMSFRDCQTNDIVGSSREHFSAVLPPHGSNVYLCALEECK